MNRRLKIKIYKSTPRWFKNFSPTLNTIIQMSLLKSLQLIDFWTISLKKLTEQQNTIQKKLNKKEKDEKN